MSNSNLQRIPSESLHHSLESMQYPSFNGNYSSSTQSLEEGHASSVDNLTTDVPPIDSNNSATRGALNEPPSDTLPPLPVTKLKKKRHPCCYFLCFSCTLILLFIIGALIFFFGFVTYPKVAFETIEPSTKSLPVVPTATGFNLNLNVVVNVTNNNIFGIDIYSMDMNAYVLTTGPSSPTPDLIGHLDSVSFPKKSTTSVSVPVSYMYLSDNSGLKNAAVALTTSCVPLTQKKRPPLKIRYEVKIGLTLLKFTNYKITISDSVSFDCPLDLSSLDSTDVLQLTSFSRQLLARFL